MRKYIIVCICLLTIALVFGLHVRLEYSDIETAIESIEGTSEQLQDDLTVLEMISEVITRYTPTSATIISVDREADTPNVTIRIVPNANNPHFDEIAYARRFYFDSWRVAETIEGMMNPLQWGGNAPQDGIFSDALQALGAIAFFLGAVISVILILCLLLFDAIATAWGVVSAVLYLIGFPISL